MGQGGKKKNELDSLALWKISDRKKKKFKKVKEDYYTLLRLDS